MPRPVEALTQMFVIIYLTVIGERQRPQHHGLMTALGQILDGEPAVPKGHAWSGPNAVAVRAPMTQALRHELNCFAARARSDNTDYATHGRQSSATLGRSLPEYFA